MHQLPRALFLAPALLTLSLALSACSGGTPSAPVAETPPAPPVVTETTPTSPTPVAEPHRLTVSADGHRLVRADGKPFLYWADTVWYLFHRPNREDARHYLQTRAAQGFTVIQVAALTLEEGLSRPNAYGDEPLDGKYSGRPRVTPGNDPNDREQYDYWDHIDYVVEQAASLGLTVALVPSWGQYVNADPIFTPETARAYGLFVGQRYKDKPIIWLMGGDYNPDTEERRAIWRAMAGGIEEGVGGRDRALITYHPTGDTTSAQFFHHEPWLDFNMWQTGHCINGREASAVLPTYRLTPTKPVINAEVIYERHAICHDRANGYAGDTEVRNATYWSVFASGGAGMAYGHDQVWGFDVYDEDKAWPRLLDTAAVRQLGSLRKLLESRAPEGREPDDTLVKGSFTGPRPTVALRGPDHAWVYLPDGGPVTVTLGRVSGSRVQASWFDPRTEQKIVVGTFANRAEQVFTAPSSGHGNDWVLLLDAVR